MKIICPSAQSKTGDIKEMHGIQDSIGAGTGGGPVCCRTKQPGQKTDRVCIKNEHRVRVWNNKLLNTKLINSGMQLGAIV